LKIIKEEQRMKKVVENSKKETEGKSTLDIYKSD
jgi:hypothetical protein